MKKTFLIFHRIISWSILLLLFLMILVFYIVESPSVALEPLKSTLKEQGISYREIEGGLLSGFKLKDVNYNNQVKAKELSLKVDFKKLQDKVLYVDNLVLDEVEVDKEFLTSLIDNNTTDENKSEGNISLPFDRVIVNNTDISLKDIAYKEYKIYGFKLHVNQLDTDMKTNHQGDVSLWLDGNMAEADLNATFKNENYHIAGILEGKKDFIAPFVKEQNLTLLSNPKLTINADGDLQNIDYDVTVHRLDFKQNEYVVHSCALHTFGKYSMAKQDVINSIKTNIESNVGNLKLDVHTTLNLDDINNTLVFDMDAGFKPKHSSITTNLRKQNISIQTLPTLTLMAKGDMKNITYKTTIRGLKAKQNEMALNLKDFSLMGQAKPLQGDISAKLLSNFDSSLAGGRVDAVATLNYKDINNTLKFTLDSDLNTHSEYLSKMLKDSNVTIKGESKINLHAKGDLNNVVFSTMVKGFRGKQNDISFDVDSLDVKGEVSPLKGDTKVTLLSNFNSYVTDGVLKAKADLNFNDIENSLKFDTTAKLKVHGKYINQFLKDSEVKLKGDSDINLQASGGLENLTVKLDASAKVLKDKRTSTVMVKTNTIKLNLKTHQIEGKLSVKSDDKEMGLDMETSFSGDYTKPEKIQTKGSVDVSNFKAFGLNLSSLAPLKLNMENGAEGMLVTIDSPKLKLKAKTKDQDHYSFKLKTDKIYPSNIMPDLPVELKKTFVKLDLEGEATLSTMYFSVQGFVEGNKGFKATLNAQNSKSGLAIDLHTKHLKLKAKGNIEKKSVIATLEIDSVTKLEKEFSSLYPFNVVPVNGPLNIEAKLKGDEVFAKLTSPKLKMEGFNIEGLDVDAHYKKELLTLNKLSFKTTGFKDKKLNKEFYLNQKGKIYLGQKRDILIDMHPNIMIKGQGSVENMSVDMNVEALPLGHPTYGSVILSSKMTYSQIGQKKKIVGGISLEKLKLFYEAKFLDVAHDPDVVVITKKDKKKKQRDSFLEDTYIDLSIYAPDAQYKTRDIDLEFTVDVKAKKRFGKELGMLGKIREINGRVIQAPKLFTVVDSTIVFRGLKDINPLLDIKVEYELPDVLITITIHGDANRPKLDFSADPAMAKKDILSYLLLGVSTASLAEGGGSLGREAQLFIMNQAARDLAYELEIDRLFIKDDGTGEGYAVQVGKKLNEDSMIILENSKEGNSIILEYDVSKNIKVEVGHHQKTIPSQSIDLFFRKRFR